MSLILSCASCEKHKSIPEPRLIGFEIQDLEQIAPDIMRVPDVGVILALREDWTEVERLTLTAMMEVNWKSFNDCFLYIYSLHNLIIETTVWYDQWLE